MRVAGPLLLLSALVSPAGAVVLYDASTGTLPTDQNWQYQSLFGGVTTAPTSTSGAVLNTTANSLTQAGWGYTNTPGLISSTGYTVSFDLRVDAESHSSNDRAGVSVIVLDSNHRGVELGLWKDQVWAQNDSPLFTHGDSANFDTTATGTRFGNTTRYSLSVLGNTYSLFADGRTAPLLTGGLKDYSSATGLAGLVYKTPNFLFFGDNTTSASGAFSLARVEVQAVPEPASMGALLLGGLALARRRKRAAQ